ncbi:MAG: hypothetical protein RR128_01090 [Clostridium sp.]
MINKDRVLKLLVDLKDWKVEYINCIKEIENCNNEIVKKILLHSSRAYFLDFHILCEDYISILLKELNLYKISISAIEGMEIIEKNGMISKEFHDFYTVSRRFRNRLAHRYKLPSDDVLLSNLKDNFQLIGELEESIKDLIAR